MCKYCEWKRDRKRRYFILHIGEGRYTCVAPLDVGGNVERFREQAINRGWREVSYEEFLPVWWEHSDFTDPCPTDLCEGDWLVNYA